MRKVALIGAFGIGNTGDELCLVKAVHDHDVVGSKALAFSSSLLLPWLHPGVDLVPMPERHHPPLTRKRRLLRRLLPSGPESILAGMEKLWKSQSYNLHPDSWVGKLCECEELCLVGGGYINGFFSLAELLYPVFVAKKLGIQIKSAPLSIGPFSGHYLASDLSWLFQNATLRARDHETADLLDAWGVDHVLEADDVYTINTVPEDQWVAGGKQPKRRTGYPVIGVNVGYQLGCQGWDGDHLVAALGNTLQAIKLLFPECMIYGFCFFRNGGELEFLTRLFDEAGLNVGEIQSFQMDFKQNVGHLRDADLVISTRFHAIVLAQALGIPSIALWKGAYYRQKMNAAVGYRPDKSVAVALDSLIERSVVNRVADFAQEQLSRSSF